MLLKFTDWLVYHVFSLQEGVRLHEAVHFFIYDTLKIFLLLFGMIFVIGFLRTYIPQEKMKYWLGRRGGLGNVMAALFGAVTPFCSCSSIPIFLSFLKAGVSLGVTFSFLITSPLINEYLVVLMAGFFGWKIAILYVVAGMGIGIVSGIVLGKMGLEKHLVADMVNSENLGETEQVFDSFKQRLQFGWIEAVLVTQKIWIWVIVGVGLGAVIHNYVPQDQVAGIMEKTGVFSVPIATILGVPMYGSCAAIVPVAVVLFQKGIPLGTALAFMMATAALSLPEAVMLRRAMNIRLIGIFFLVTTVAIIVIGYGFNAIQLLI